MCVSLEIQFNRLQCAPKQKLNCKMKKGNKCHGAENEIENSRWNANVENVQNISYTKL